MRSSHFPGVQATGGGDDGGCDDDGGVPVVDTAPEWSRCRHTICATLSRPSRCMLGHKSAVMTLDVYADLFDSDLDDVACVIDSAVQVIVRDVDKTWAREHEIMLKDLKTLIFEALQKVGDEGLEPFALVFPDRCHSAVFPVFPTVPAWFAIHCKSL